MLLLLLLRFDSVVYEGVCRRSRKRFTAEHEHARDSQPTQTPTADVSLQGRSHSAEIATKTWRALMSPVLRRTQRTQHYANHDSPGAPSGAARSPLLPGCSSFHDNTRRMQLRRG